MGVVDWHSKRGERVYLSHLKDQNWNCQKNNEIIFVASGVPKLKLNFERPTSAYSRTQAPFGLLVFHYTYTLRFEEFFSYIILQEISLRSFYEMFFWNTELRILLPFPFPYG